MAVMEHIVGVSVTATNGGFVVVVVAVVMAVWWYLWLLLLKKKKKFIVVICFRVCVFVCAGCLLNVPATRMCIS